MDMFDTVEQSGIPLPWFLSNNQCTINHRWLLNPQCNTHLTNVKYYILPVNLFNVFSVKHFESIFITWQIHEHSILTIKVFFKGKWDGTNLLYRVWSVVSKPKCCRWLGCWRVILRIYRKVLVKITKKTLKIPKKIPNAHIPILTNQPVNGIHEFILEIKINSKHIYLPKSAIFPYFIPKSLFLPGFWGANSQKWLLSKCIQNESTSWICKWAFIQLTPILYWFKVGPSTSPNISMVKVSIYLRNVKI